MVRLYFLPKIGFMFIKQFVKIKNFTWHSEWNFAKWTNQPTNSLKTAHNTDFFGEKLAKLRQILPEIFSENTLDLEKLKTLLGDHPAQNERYGLNWAGKSTAYQALQRPTNNTLTACPAESVDFDTTQNIFIESDNLEALKILQNLMQTKSKWFTLTHRIIRATILFITMILAKAKKSMKLPQAIEISMANY